MAFGFGGNSLFCSEGGEVKFVISLTIHHDTWDEDGEEGGRAFGCSGSHTEGRGISAIGMALVADGADNGKYLVGWSRATEGEGGKVGDEKGPAVLLEGFVSVGAHKGSFGAKAVCGWPGMVASAGSVHVVEAKRIQLRRGAHGRASPW